MITHKKTWKCIRRSACAFTILSVALLSSACKRQQEVIDLSGARSVPTETVQSASAPESVDSADSLTLDTAETTADASSTKKGIHVMMETYMNNKIFIQYPVIQDLNDDDRTASANELLKNNALSILGGWGINEAKDTLELTCKVVSADQSRLTVIYRGYCYPNQASYPSNLFLTNTVDLTEISDIRLSDYADPVQLADYVMSDGVVLSGVNQADQPAILEFLKNTDREQNVALLANADFGGTNGFPGCFSYESNGEIYIMLPVTHELGDYVTVVYTPEDK